MLKATKWELEWVLILEPQVFQDERGFFMETYSKRELANVGIHDDFVQDNHSKSSKWVLRGMHFQLPPHAQSKLVRVVSGSVYDVFIDLRRSSPTFGKWQWVVLSSTNKLQIYIPKGFAHGFLTLEDNTEFLYKCSDFYDRSSDGWIDYSDPELAIDWSAHMSIEHFIISEKDRHHPTFREFQERNTFE